MSKTINCSVIFFLPERTGGVGAEHVQFVGEKAQFVKSVLKSGTGGVGFYFHVKTGGNEPAVNLIAFQFGEVDAVGGKAAERFVQRGGNRFDPEHAGGEHKI